MLDFDLIILWWKVKIRAAWHYNGFCRDAAEGAMEISLVDWVGADVGVLPCPKLC